MEEEFYDGTDVKAEGQTGTADFVNEYEVNAMRKGQRKYEECVKVIGTVANGMRIKNLVGQDYKLYKKRYLQLSVVVKQPP